MRSPGTGGSCFALGFMLIWTVMTLGVTGAGLYGVARQLHAMLYPRVEGTILQSAVVQGLDSDGDPTYAFSVKYTYEVGGQRYESTQYSYSTWRTSERSHVERRVARFPERSPVPVYYRPGAPSDAVLVTGLQSTELMGLLFLMPFLVATIAGWHTLIRGRRQAEGIRSFVRGGRTYVPLRDTAPLIRGLLAAGGMAFLLLIVIAVAWGADPPAQAVVIAYALVTALGVLVWQRQGARRKAGRYDLIVDEARRQLVLPVGPGRPLPLEVAWQDISAVACMRHTYEDSEGDTQVAWRPVVELRGAKDKRSEPVSEPIVEWHDKDRAEALVDWLSARLGR